MVNLAQRDRWAWLRLRLVIMLVLAFLGRVQRLAHLLCPCWTARLWGLNLDQVDLRALFVGLPLVAICLSLLCYRQLDLYCSLIRHRGILLFLLIPWTHFLWVLVRLLSQIDQLESRRAHQPRALRQLQMAKALLLLSCPRQAHPLALRPGRRRLSRLLPRAPSFRSTTRCS